MYNQSTKPIKPQEPNPKTPTSKPSVRKPSMCYKIMEVQYVKPL